MTTTEHAGPVPVSPGPAPSPGNVVARVLHWLEAGYPDGVPRQDRFPLVALLKRRLTEEQTLEVIVDLTAPHVRASRADEPITAAEIETLIHRQLSETPSAADVSRVSARLAAGGWPLADAFPADLSGPDRPGGPGQT